ncbi:E3 ubiquitin-protein ligase RNF10 isoform X2 [Lampetra planeri]
MTESPDGSHVMERRASARAGHVTPAPPSRDAIRDAKPDAKAGGGGRLRHGRKREVPQPFPKPEVVAGANRRAAPQKNKTFDKRPPTRGAGKPAGTFTVGGGREEVMYDQQTELADLARGRKKVNVNHLFNFTLEPRERFSPYHPSTWSRKGGAWWGQKQKPFNKELFLQANCQFVVLDQCDYSVYLADPDTLVDWDLVQQVRLLSHGVLSCPICLYPPTAARITRCGHVFCWPCILHYLALSDEPWRKCPICYEAVHKKHLRSVVTKETHQFAVGDTITLQLMKREKGSAIALPRSQWFQVDKPLSVIDAQNSHHCKLLLASRADVQTSLSLEQEQLVQQLLEESDTAEACFVQAALGELQNQLKCFEDAGADVGTTLEMQNLSLAEASEPDSHEVKEPTSLTNCNKQAVHRYASAFDEEFEEEVAKEAAEPDGAQEEEVQLEGAAGLAATEQEQQQQQQQCLQQEGHGCEVLEEEEASSQNNLHHYYYQAEDGQHMYMLPMNRRCLLQEHGGPEGCPDRVTAHIMDIESFSMTEYHRKRYNYLDHLPLTCEISFCEVALQPPLVTQATLQYFTADIERRRVLRQKKARDERRRERKIEMEENKKHGIYPGMRVPLENLRQFPSFGSSPECGPGGPTDDTVVMEMSSPAVLHSPQDSSSNSSAAGSFLSPLAPAFVPGSPSAVESIVEDESHLPSFAQWQPSYWMCFSLVTCRCLRMEKLNRMPGRGMWTREHQLTQQRRWVPVWIAMPRATRRACLCPAFRTRSARAWSLHCSLWRLLLLLMKPRQRHHQTAPRKEKVEKRRKSR